MKKSLLFIFPFLFCVSVKAQNLLANPGFEDVNTCEELHQQCSPEAWFNIHPVKPPPIFPRVVPPPFEGRDLLILSVENLYNPVVGRSYVYTKLCCPLQKGKKYILSFYLHTAGTKFYSVDFAFRDIEFALNNFNPDTLKPSLRFTAMDISEKNGGWNFIDSSITATGNERFLLLGNLSRDTFKFKANQRMSINNDVYYFIDQISLRPAIPETPCDQYAQNITKLYAQNKRHTENVLTDTVPDVITDTLTVPAVYFETDKSILKPSFKKLLDSLSISLKNKNVQSLKIIGHTDDRNTEAYNLKLSAERALAVKKYLLQKRSIPENVIFAEGKGEAFPKLLNTSEKARAVNRRVEIIVSYTLNPAILRSRSAIP